MDLVAGTNKQRLLLALVATGVAGIVALQLFKKKERRTPPPSAKATLFQFIAGMTGGQMHEFLIEQFQKSGNIFRLPIPGVVVVANADDARAIYKDPLTTKPRAMYGALDSFSSGPNILTISSGDAWHHRRKGINPAFAPKLVKRMNAVALEKADKWVSERLVPLMEKGESFDAGTEMILVTVSVICKAAFEYDISHQESKEMHEAMRDSVEEFSIKSMVNPMRQFGTWMLPERRQAFCQAEKLKVFAYKIIDLYRKRESPAADTVIDLMVKNSNYKDDSERVPDIIMLLFAGHDTTGYTLAFSLLELSKNPGEQQKLRERLSSAEGTPYLKAVLNETMRLHTVSPLSAIKQLGRDFVSKDGYFIPKGSIAFIAQVALARDPVLFPNPHEFQPYRWLNATDSAKQALFPFSLGNRNCVGQALANAELSSMVPRLIRQFEFTVEEEGCIETQGTRRLNGCELKATRIPTS